MSASPVDPRRELGELYRATREPSFVDVPEMAFLMVDGRGDPNASAAYGEATAALSAVAYAAKLDVRDAGGPDYAVMPLEALWWVEDAEAGADAAAGEWSWTVMIMVPDAVTGAFVDAARTRASTRGDLPSLSRLRLERFAEGRCAQLLHVGAYADEGPALERLHAFIAEAGDERAGKHHETYLGDPRRTPPERLRTILRQPVR